MDGDRVDFFVSHAGSDRAWAEWVAWQLIEAGYRVELDVWDWAAGHNFVMAMNYALERADRVVALFSAAYFERPRHTSLEWATSMQPIPGMEENRLVPLRLEDVPSREMPALLRPLIFRDLFGLAEKRAKQVLLEAVAGPRRPVHEPGFPGRTVPDGLGMLGGLGPRLPGSLPSVWNMPTRNRGFAGRDALLVTVRKRLLSGDQAVVLALHGIGGVGKSQLAVEYAYRFAGGYDIAWWIAAERPGLIGEQFAALAVELGCGEHGAGADVVRRAVLSQLRERGRWLLIFDNAENPRAVLKWLPAGSGHVLITTRGRRWAEIATPVEVNVLARTESVALLAERVPELLDADADRLAEQLGDLPLAVAQAAGYLGETGMSVVRYLDLLRTQAARILDQGRPVSYPRSLAAATRLAADRLVRHDPAAAELVNICAFLAPEPIQEDLFIRAVDQLSGLLAARVPEPLGWPQMLAQIAGHSLARIDQRGLQLHRLTQAILRDRLAPGRGNTMRVCVESILVANDPGNPEDPESWPKWGRLMPHLLATDPAATSNRDLRDLACKAVWYLLMRGDARSSLDLSERLHQQWRSQLGEDDLDTLRAANCLAVALQQIGRFDAARHLNEGTLAHYRRILGSDDLATLASASNLATDLHELGELQAARELDEDTLAHYRRILGSDDPRTLISASNLAEHMHELGDLRAALSLDQDTFSRRRRILGEDHPETLTSASNLAANMRGLGDLSAARELDEDTLARRRRILGDDHPRTLISASNLAEDLRIIGELQTARELDEDTLARRRRILGDDHPHTLLSEKNLAEDIRKITGQRENPCS